jgi:hypothetical protein
MATGVLMDGMELPAAKVGWLAVFIAWFKLWGFKLVKLLIGIGYVAVIGEGLRMVVPALGIKLYKLPLLGALRQYQGWHDLDLALFAGMLLFALSSWIWCALLETWLYDNTALQVTDRAAAKYEKFLGVLGSIILLSDACLFYRAMTFVGWGAKSFSHSAALCTLAYLAVLVAVCVVSVNLKRNYLSLKRGRKPQGVPYEAPNDLRVDVLFPRMSGANGANGSRVSA